MYTLEFEMTGLPITLNKRVHWAVKAKQNKHWTRMVHLLTLGRRPPVPLKRARLTLTRLSSSEPDFDNNVSGFKGIIDALRYCKIIEDDKQSNIGGSVYAWQKVPKGQGGVRVRVEQLE